MRTKSRASIRLEKGNVASEMSKIDFDLKAIKEIKKRKKGVYKRNSKQSGSKRK